MMMMMMMMILLCFDFFDVAPSVGSLVDVIALVLSSRHSVSCSFHCSMECRRSYLLGKLQTFVR